MNKESNDTVNNWTELLDNHITCNDKKIGSQSNNTNNSSNNTNNNSNEANKINEIDNFEEMGLNMNLLRGIYGYGFEKPSKIQQKTISIVLSGRDLIAQSHSGTGKTGAFTIAALQTINENLEYIQTIILSPTRELSQQINSVVIDLSRYTKIKTSLCVGGTNIDENVRQLNKVHIIIGTPGRINDLIKRRAFNILNVKLMILDEADQLLQKEFIGQTRDIIKELNGKTQICAYSATLKEDSLSITTRFMNNPVNMLIEKEKLSLKEITQYYINVQEERYKLDSLNDLYNKLSIGQCIIYVNYKDGAIRLRDSLIDYGHSAIAIHGSLSAVERTEIMKKFRSGEYRVLISTDLLARGIDVQQVSYVINYDLPTDLESYIHRIGRSGRFGKKGVSINFVTRRNIRLHKSLQQYYNTVIDEMPEPDLFNNILKNN